MGRLSDGSRKVLEISEVSGMSNGHILLNPLYLYDFTEDNLKATGNPVKDTFRLGINGYGDIQTLCETCDKQEVLSDGS